MHLDYELRFVAIGAEHTNMLKIEYACGTKMWYRDGKLHRDGGPAVLHSNGDCEWWNNGQLYYVNVNVNSNGLNVLV